MRQFYRVVKLEVQVLPALTQIIWIARGHRRPIAEYARNSPLLNLYGLVLVKGQYLRHNRWLACPQKGIDTVSSQ